MRRAITLFLALTLGLVSCTNSFLPTPLLFTKLIDANNEVKQLYLQCSVEGNYFAEKAGCQPALLEEKTVSTMELAKEFISADIKQPQGYDVYLSVVMIYFRISLRNTEEYTEAEMIARQFFEVQKATSGRAITDARFYWAAISSAHAAWQWNNDRLALNAERKVELLQCYAEGSLAFQDIVPGPRKIRLLQSLEVLKAITDAI